MKRWRLFQSGKSYKQPKLKLKKWDLKECITEI